MKVLENEGVVRSLELVSDVTLLLFTSLLEELMLDILGMILLLLLLL